MRYASTMASTQAPGAPVGHPSQIVVELGGQTHAQATGFVTTATRLPVLLAIALAAACQHGTPNPYANPGANSNANSNGNPTRAELPSPVMRVSVANGTLALTDSADMSDAQRTINDVVERLGPSLTDSTAGQLIVTVFKKLQRSYDERDASASRALISNARALVDAYATFGNDDAQQLSAIRVALTRLANSV